MSQLLSEINQLCAELRSDKVTTRNKAIERLDHLLTNSKAELTSQLDNEHEQYICWTEVFESTITAILKHAVRVDEQKDAKSAQTLRNKNYLFGGVINMLIEYNIEFGNKLLPKSCIFNAFTDGFRARSAIIHFNELFLQLLERGIFQSKLFVRELKVSEYSLILSHLFELNVGNDEKLRFTLLRTIIQTTELAVKHVQLNVDLIDYLPELIMFARKANDERRRADVLKLLLLFIDQLGIDYYHSICTELLVLMPVVCGFYDARQKPENKEVFFHAMYLALQTMYPQINNGIYTTLNIALDEHWNKCLRKLRTIVDMEIKERKLIHHRSIVNSSSNRMNYFIKMAALVTKLIYWHLHDATDAESKPKKAKNDDKMDIILKLVQPDVNTYNEIWLAILAELLNHNSYNVLLNASNQRNVLEAIWKVLQQFQNSNNLQQIRLIVTHLLPHEQQLKIDNSIPNDFCNDLWSKITDYLINDENFNSNEMIHEKELLLQQLILAQKIIPTQCEQLLNVYTSKSTMRRAICMETVRLMLLHAEQCGIDKSSDIIVARIINWTYETKTNVKHILLNVAPIEPSLVADTCAIAVINFLQSLPIKNKTPAATNLSHEMKLLLYKHNRKLLCLEQHALELQLRLQQQKQENIVEKLNCFFQCNYELLMRHLQFETSRDTTCRDILNDLTPLLKMVCLMQKFLSYNVFTAYDYAQCPLIKRIGFFLSHLEFQLKSNKPTEIPRANLNSILTALQAIFSIFTMEATLLSYLEREPLEEVLIFVGDALKFYVNQLHHNLDDSSDGADMCVVILAHLCASKSHDAFSYILNSGIDMQQHTHNLLNIIKIFCNQQNFNQQIAEWFMEELKLVFKMHHTNIEIVAKITDLLPAMFKYVQQFKDALQTLLIALKSLLTIAYKKSYTVNLTVKLLQSLREITRYCSSIFLKEDFQNICLSAAKFLTSPSLEIQLAAINTITAFLDVNWLQITGDSMQWYFEFCDQLISLIDWKNLPTNNIDMEQNANAAALQVLIAVFSFSTYHQEYALNNLAIICQLRNLTAADLCSIEQVANYFERPLAILTRVYMHNVIHNWTKANNSILKFPYFLSHQTLNDFVRENLSTIATCLLLYNDAASMNEIKRLQKFVNKEEIMQSILPMAHALALPQESSCLEAQRPEFETHLQKLLENCEVIGINALAKKDFDWRIVFNLMQLLHDTEYFKSKLTISLQFEQNMWFHISHTSLLNCLRFYVKHNLADENKIFAHIIASQPLELIQALDSLKRITSECFFTTNKLQKFGCFCILAEIIVDSLHKIEKNSCFFARDILFFTLQFYQTAENSLIREAALNFLGTLLQKRAINGSSSVIPEYKNFCKNLIAALNSENQQKINETISLLRENAQIESLSELFECDALTSVDFIELMNSLSSTKSIGLEGLRKLRQFVVANKNLLEVEDKLCYKLIKILVDIVRTVGEKNEHERNEAAICLGEIGAFKISGVSYYLHSDTALYELANSMHPMQYFTRCILRALETCLLTFKVSTYQAIYEVAKQVVNCSYASELIEDYRYLNVFCLAKKIENCLDMYASVPEIDWCAILKSTEMLDSYEKWISDFMSRIFATCSWNAFQQLSLEDSNFADAALECFVKLLLENKQKHLPKLFQMLEYYFELLNSAIDGATEIKGIFQNKRVATKLLNICECIRLHNDWKIPINLLHLSRASNYCQAYFMSIMYLELWALNQKEQKSQQPSQSELLGNELFQECATEAYQSINFCEAISGFLSPMQSRLDFLNLNNNWSEMLLEANTKTQINDKVYTTMLKRNGMLTLAGLSQESAKTIDYEICWRLNQWDTAVEGHAHINAFNKLENEFEKHHFNALKCIFNREENNTLAAIKNARKCVQLILQQISVECLQSVYKLLTWLQLLQQAEDFCQIQFGSSSEAVDIFPKWQRDAQLQYGSFKFKEQVLAHQIALFKTAGVRASRKITTFYKENPIECCLLKCVKECKRVGEMNLAIGYLSSLQNMQISNEINRLNVLLEDAEICMRTGRRQITKAILQHVLKNKDFACCLQRVRAYRMHGELLMESNSENFESVLANYFQGSLKLLQKFSSLKTELLERNPHIFDVQSFEDFERDSKQSAYEIIAKYADREYTQLNTYVNSDEFQMKCQIIQQNRKAAESVEKKSNDRDRQVGVMQLKRFANLDEQEVQSIEQKRTSNLCIAVEHYIQFCCIDGNASSPAIYRIIGLWFANKANNELQSQIIKNIHNVPSYKFICALNQITARLSSNNQAFVDILKSLLVRCMQDHPQQTVYQLFPLVYAFTDAASVSNSPHNRVSISKEIIAKAKNKQNTNCIKQVEQMFPALIEFANVNIMDSKATSVALSEKLKRLRNLDAIQCPTIDLPVSPNKEYNITTIVKWNDNASLVGGINVPRKIVCLCSNGKTYAQLLKGKDDLRQDAVMQQLFAIINDLLRDNPETVERQLALRTYKIVPLSMRSGILEWCENTTPLGLYLAGDKDGGAHKRYHPHEYSVGKCRSLSMQHLKSDVDKRYKIYAHICEHITPVLQYFFFEKFLVPGVWFERRLAYINSVATTSIVGFILGLGDRHARNILIDEITGEVIHIDFGIAFEQGKIMPTPETVPFRLTRDIVAPMGVCETNGIFKKSCEATMQILRRNIDIITTILEVLLYDPLYIWKVVLQADFTKERGEEKNIMAQRALLCIQNKLEGKQAGIIGVSDVEVQVQRLINEATSYRNLCMHYPGWDPYL